jgi:hypothetical protein
MPTRIAGMRRDDVVHNSLVNRLELTEFDCSNVNEIAVALRSSESSFLLAECRQ